MLHSKRGAHQKQSFELDNKKLVIWLWSLSLLAAVHTGQRLEMISLEGAIGISAYLAHTQAHTISEASEIAGYSCSLITGPK